MIEYDESWGTWNRNIREEIDRIFGGTKEANICGRHKGLNEVFVENTGNVGVSWSGLFESGLQQKGF